VSDPKETSERLGLVPMAPLEIRAQTGCGELLRQMSGTAFGGRALGESAQVMEEMLRSDCWVVMTMSGAMTMAGLGPLLMLMIERGWVDCLVATGALLGHGLVQDLGMTHYKAKSSISDEEYFRLKLNRVYDTIEPERNLDALEEIVRQLLGELADAGSKKTVGTAELLAFLGDRLPGDGVLQVAARKQVAMYIPAFTDSELGLDFAIHQLLRRREGKDALAYDGFRDLEAFADQCERVFEAGRPLGIFTVGGGVPRNWAQQVGPYIDIRNTRLGKKVPPPRFSHGVRICPDAVHYGHLSGCTFSEGVSWGKFIPESEGGRYAELLADATIAWPLLVQAMLDRGL
jgi:deoxyhypusine synthase